MSKSDELMLAKLGIDPKSIKAISPAWQRAHYRAANNWLTKYKPSAESSNLQLKTVLRFFGM